MVFFVTVFLAFIGFISMPLVGSAQIVPSIWSNGVNITEEPIPNIAQNRGNYDCTNSSHKSRYISKIKRDVSDQLILDAETIETDGKSYTNVCGVQSEHGYIAGNLFSPTDVLGRVLPVIATAANYQMVGVPNSNAVLFLTASNNGGLQLSVNYNLPGIGKLDAQTYGSGISAKHELTWKVDRINEFLKYKDNSIVSIDNYAFSANGDYMLVYLRGRGLAKVNLNDLTLTPIIAMNLSSGIQLSISNDGKYAASYRSGNFYIHDLTSCVRSATAGNWVSDDSLDNSCGFKQVYQDIKTVYSEASVFSRLRFAPNGGTVYTDVGWSSANGFVWRRLKLSAKNYVANVSGYLAMGDSFSSGEGDLEGGEWYEPGTDEQGNIATFENRNLCHLSRRSYPYLIAVDQGYLSSNSISPPGNGAFHSVACSGAVVRNIKGDKNVRPSTCPNSEDIFRESENQYCDLFQGSLDRWQPGRIKQIDFIDTKIFGGYSSNEPLPEVITLGIGGNDAGFGDIINACLAPGTCGQAVAGSVESANLAVNIASLKPRLVEVYKSLKQLSPESRVYVHGYPIFVKGYGGNCAVNVQLDSQETAMVEQGVRYINEVVRSASLEAGVFYIDVTETLSGRNLCATDDPTLIAVNGVTAGNDVSPTVAKLLTLGFCQARKCFGKESFHPNNKGHQLYKEAILNQTQNLTAPVPVASTQEYPLPSQSYFGTDAVNRVANLSLSGATEVYKPGEFIELVGDGLVVRQDGFMPRSILRIEAHSDPVLIKEVSVSSQGQIDTSISLPSLEPGSHQIHLIGTDSFGRPIDLFETIIVGQSTDDFDGDGIDNQNDSCNTLENSGVDIDKDNIDDACDAWVGPAPIVVEEPTVDAPTDEQPPVDTEENVNPNTPAGQVLGISTSIEPDKQKILGLQTTGINIVLGLIAGLLLAAITSVVYLARHRIHKR